MAGSELAGPSPSRAAVNGLQHFGPNAETTLVTRPLRLFPDPLTQQSLMHAGAQRHPRDRQGCGRRNCHLVGVAPERLDRSGLFWAAGEHFASTWGCRPTICTPDIGYSNRKRGGRLTATRTPNGNAVHIDQKNIQRAKKAEL